MKLGVVVTAGLLAFTGVLAHAQTKDLKGPPAFQVKRNVHIADATDGKLVEPKRDELRLWEDGVEQKITALSAYSGPLYLQIVLDDSGSMVSQRANLTAAAKFIVESMEEGSKAQIVRFGGPERVRVANEWTDDKPLLLKALDEVPRGGGSPIFDGVWTTLDQIKMAKVAEDKRFAVVLISDCMEGGSRTKSHVLLEELIKIDVPLFTVSLTAPVSRDGVPDPRFEELVKRFDSFPHDSALASGGSVYFPLRGENAKLPMTESLKGLAIELQSQFYLTYTPTNRARDGKERKFHIEVNEASDEKRTVSIKDTHVVTLQK